MVVHVDYFEKYAQEVCVRVMSRDVSTRFFSNEQCFDKVLPPFGMMSWCFFYLYSQSSPVMEEGTAYDRLMRKLYMCRCSRSIFHNWYRGTDVLRRFYDQLYSLQKSYRGDFAPISLKNVL